MSAEPTDQVDMEPQQPNDESNHQQEKVDEQVEEAIPSNQPAIEAEELLTPHNTQEPEVDYEDVINTLERRADSLASKLHRIEGELARQNRASNELKLLLEESRMREQQTEIDRAKLAATVQANRETQQKYERLLDELSKRLESFESRESVEDLQLRLQQAQRKVEYLQLELKNHQSGRIVTTPAVLASAEAQIKDLQAIDMLKKELALKELQRNVLIAEIAEFHKQVQHFNEQIAVQLQKSSQLQSHINLLSERLRLELEKRTDNETTIQQFREMLTRKENEVSMLASKLESEVKRKRENDSSNHLLEKEELLKDYIALEKGYVVLQEKLDLQLEKNTKLEQSLNFAKQGNISKSQYDLLAKRYVHLKGCLESAMKKLALLAQGEGSKISFVEPGRESELSADKIVLENQVKQLQAYRTMYEQTLNVEKNPEEAIELARLRKLVETQKKQVEEADHTVEICHAELSMKNQLLNDFAQKCFQYSNQLDKLYKQHNILLREVNQLRADCELGELRQKGSEARHLDLLGYLGDLQSECSNWRKAYETLKENISVSQEAKRPTEHFNIERPTNPRIDVRVVEAHALRFPTEQAAQTESQEYHLNELKSVYSKGKQYVKKMTALFEPIDSLRKELEKSKTNYLGLMDGYRASMNELGAERHELESWKSRTRQSIERQLRDEFIELRELLDNERLLKALKKAKYLITEYSKQEEAANQEAAPDQTAALDQPPQQSDAAEAMVQEPEDDALKL